MNAIRSLSEEVFKQNQNFSEPGVYQAIELEDSGDKQEVTKFKEDELCTWFSLNCDDQHIPGELKPTPTLKLASIHRTSGARLMISSSAFNRIFDSMRADPSVKYMICREYDGFHEYHSEGFLLTRFIGNAMYALVWTFDPITLKTAALFINRWKIVFEQFASVLSEFRALMCTPSLLCFVSTFFLVRNFDSETGGWELATIQHIEEKTGFGPHPSGWRGVEPLSYINRFNINQLTSWLQATNEIAGNAVNRSRHQKHGLQLLAMIQEEDIREENFGLTTASSIARGKADLGDLAKAVLPLQRHISSYIEYSEYLKDRAGRLSNVVSGLSDIRNQNSRLTPR